VYAVKRGWRIKTGFGVPGREGIYRRSAALIAREAFLIGNEG